MRAPLLFVLSLLLSVAPHATAQTWDKDNNAGQQALEQGKYADAERLFLAAVQEIQPSPAQDLRLPSTLSNLGLAYLLQSKLADAEKTLRHAIDLAEAAKGRNEPLIALSEDNLVQVYLREGAMEKAISSCKHALEVREANLGSENADVATNLTNLGTLYFGYAKLTDTRKVRTAAGLEHSPTMRTLRGQMIGFHGYFAAQQVANDNSVGEFDALAPGSTETDVRYDMGRLEKAEKFYREGLAVREKTLGSDSPLVANSLEYLAGTYSAENKYKKAEELYRQLLAMLERSAGRDSTALLPVMGEIENAAVQRGGYGEAAAIYGRDLAIREKAFGAESPKLVESLEGYAEVLRKQKKKEAADALAARAETITAQQRPH